MNVVLRPKFRLQKSKEKCVSNCPRFLSNWIFRLTRKSLSLLPNFNYLYSSAFRVSCILERIPVRLPRGPPRLRKLPKQKHHRVQILFYTIVKCIERFPARSNLEECTSSRSLRDHFVLQRFCRRLVLVSGNFGEYRGLLAGSRL
jgi:hypothetical protein